ncbi:hypothetical protein FDECE_6431 [Fusarium decemcellulare]|nr:hypothetical protein FDECE_6431 [Fusarium decemcellulare]
MPSISIVVQPPTRAQASTLLYPYLIAQLTSRRSYAGCYFFAMAVLLAQNGMVVESLAGETTVTGVDFQASGSRTSVCFPFTNLWIVHEGTYTIRVDVYRVLPGDEQTTTYEGQAESNLITVVRDEVSTGRPCKWHPTLAV